MPKPKVSPSTPSGRRVAAQSLACTTCSLSSSRVHICMECVHFACPGKHLERHHAEARHGFFVDSLYGQGSV